MFMNVHLTKINPNPWQTRESVDEEYIAQLAADIKKNGLLQRPMGRVVVDGEVMESRHIHRSTARVELAFGHNRLAAYEHNGEVTIPIDLREIDDEQMAIYAWAENEQRRDLTPLEKARAIQKRIDEFDWTHEEAGERLGMSRAGVSNALRLLELPAEVREDERIEKLSARSAEAILSVYQLPEEVIESAKSVAWIDTPEEMTEKALSDKKNSNQIRTYRQLILDWTCEKMDDVEFMDHAFIRTKDMVAEKCTDCDHKFVRAQTTYCPKPECLKAKRESWLEIELEAASLEFGIPILTEEERQNGLQTFYGLKEHSQGEGGIIGAGCPNLRLRTDRYAGEGELVSDKYPNVAVGCINTDCQCLQDRVEAAEAARLEEIKDDPEFQAQQSREEQCLTEIIEPAEEKVRAMFDTELDNITFWKELLRTFNVMSIRDAENLSEVFDKLAHKMINYRLPHYPADHMEQTREFMAEFLARFGEEL